MAREPCGKVRGCWVAAQSRWGEAARKLAELLNDDTFRSLEGKSKHTLWLELCEIVTKHPKVRRTRRGGRRPSRHAHAPPCVGEAAAPPTTPPRHSCSRAA